MPAIAVEEQISEINRKLDRISDELERESRGRNDSSDPRSSPVGAVQQLGSIRDLLADLQPVSREIFKDAVVRMEELEKKGYFRFASGAGEILDAFVVAHSERDLNQARASMPHLVGFLRELTRPEVLQALEAIVYGFGEVQASAKQDVSMFQLLRNLNTPEARRGLAIIVKFLSVVGAASSAPENHRELNAARKE